MQKMPLNSGNVAEFVAPEQFFVATSQGNAFGLSNLNMSLFGAFRV